MFRDTVGQVWVCTYVKTCNTGIIMRTKLVSALLVGETLVGQNRDLIVCGKGCIGGKMQYLVSINSPIHMKLAKARYQ